MVPATVYRSAAWNCQTSFSALKPLPALPAFPALLQDLGNFLPLVDKGQGCGIHAEP